MHKALNACQQEWVKEAEEEHNDTKESLDDEKVKWTSNSQPRARSGFFQKRIETNSFCGLQRHEHSNKEGIDFSWDAVLDTGSSFTATHNERPLDNKVWDKDGLHCDTNAGKQRCTLERRNARIGEAHVA